MLITEKKPKSVTSECYRTLRTNIQFSNFDGEMKTLLVTSPGPSEGKSSTTCNLAMTYALGDKKVLVVDCDLRKPTIHKKFRTLNKVGLSNCLARGLDPEKVIIKYKPNLHIMPSGVIPPNPAEMLASEKMKKFIDSMKEKYDLVIIDSPPILPVTDAQILSTETDGVIMVVAAAQTTKEAALKARDLLMKVDANILGVVMAKLDKKVGYNYSEEYMYYYGEKKESAKPRGNRFGRKRKNK